MKKTLFLAQYRLISILLIVSLLFLGFASSSLFFTYIFKQSSESLEANADIIKQYTDTFVYTDGTRVIINPQFQTALSITEDMSGVKILIIDVNGKVIMCSCSENSSCSHLSSLVDPSFIQSVKSSGGMSCGTSISPIYDESMFSFAIPLYSNEMFIGSAVVSSGTSSLNDIRWASVVITLASIFAVLIIALIFAHIFAMRLANPLHEIAETATDFTHGNLSRRVSINNSIDEINELSSSFNNMADYVQSSTEHQNNLIANISHELRTPMTAIIGYLDGIQDGTIPADKAPEYYDIISSEVRRMSRLVNKTMELSKLQTRRAEPNIVPFDICETVRRVLLGSYSKIEAKNLEVAVVFEDDSVIAMGDCDDITQVVTNLLDNAIKFAYENTTLGIKIERVGKKVHVSVRNCGPDIPKEEIPFIFEHFYKSDRSRSKDHDGLGLGLYIVRIILNNHKQNISVTSGGGVTDFTFTLDTGINN